MFYPVVGDLARVRERIYRYTKTRAGDLKDFAYLEEHVESYICPALVLFAARINGQVTENAISFAEVLQLIYMASTIHRNINEDGLFQGNKAFDPRDGCQYPVLVGDYLYSKAFAILIETDNTEHMVSLSEMVCKINEGGIIRNKSQGGVVRLDVWREIIRLEKAELLAGCCRLGAEAGGADKESRFYLSKFGCALGMAMGMTEIKRFDQADIYFNEALSHLDRLVPGEYRDNLKNMVLCLADKNIDSKKMVC
ncbi:MAG: polyprenyl synthetase family protein [Bacillota bacterium]